MDTRILTASIGELAPFLSLWPSSGKHFSLTASFVYRHKPKLFIKPDIK